MARNNMNFSATLRLNNAQFKKGVADVQRSLKSLQNSFLGLAGALGLGLSLNRLGNQLMDTAVKMSTAKNVLKNVSSDMREYGDSIEWLRKISNDYGQDLIVLMNSFAQFRAAASSSKLTLDQMREIYEALTRAAGAYHMSADRTNDMMIAVTQMLSKGRVAAEELRRQLGNSLPGAFNLMAQAAYNAGVITENSTAALEKAMKAGKVMAEDVLPSFGKVLNDVTENAEFESLQTSLNRLKNSWTEMVEAGNFEDIYKGIIDGANNVVKFFSKSFWPKIATGAAAIFGTAVTKRLTTMRTQFLADAKQMADGAAASFNTLTNGLYKSAQAVKKLGANMIAVFQTDENGNVKNGAIAEIAKVKPKNFETVIDGTKAYKKELLDATIAAKKFNQTQLERAKNYKLATGKELFSQKQIDRIKKENIELDKNIDLVQKRGIEGEVAAGRAAKLGQVMKNVGAVVRSALASFAIGALIAGLTYIVTKLVEAHKEAKRIANIAEDMKKAVFEVGEEETSRIGKLNLIKKAIEDINSSTDEGTKIALIKNLNKELGRTGDNLLTIESDINNEVIPAIDDYIKKLKTAATQQAILAQVSSATSRVTKLELENMSLMMDPNYGKTRSRQRVVGSGPNAHIVENVELTKEARDIAGQIKKNTDEIEQLNKGINFLFNPKVAEDNFVGPVPPWQANQETARAILGISTPSNKQNNNDGPSGSGKDKNTPKGILREYAEELEKLNNQLGAGAILAADYEEKVKKLNQKTFEDLSGLGMGNLTNSKMFGKNAISQDAMDKIVAPLKAAAQSAMLEALDDPSVAEEFDAEMKDEADKAYKAFKDAWDRYLGYVKQRPASEKIEADDALLKSNKKKKGQTYTERDTYLNTAVLKASEKEFENLEKYRDTLKEALKTETSEENIKRLNKELDNVIDRLIRLGVITKDLRTKVQVAEFEKEISDLKKEGIEGVFSSLTTLSNGMDNLYNAYKSIQQINDKTWKNEDLEEFLTYMNAIIQTLEVMKGLYVALETVTKTYAAIKEKSAMKAMIANQMEAASETAKGGAAAGAAAAGGASSVASIPFVGPALAIAAIAAIVAAIIAANSKVKKFAKGGFVGGASYSGDKVPAMVNSGELVLNPAQQRNLLNLANGKSGAGGGKVEFKISGADLVGTLNNYQRLRR